MPSSTLTKAEEVLESAVQKIREEFEGPFPVLTETDRNRFVEEEERLREQLRETAKLESTRSTWRCLFLPPSPQATKCLRDAQGLHQRIREDITERLRTRLSGRINPPPPSGHRLGSSGVPEADTGLSPARDDPKPPSGIITSPLNMHCSVSESEVLRMNANSVGHDDHDYTSDIEEAINSPLETSSESSESSHDFLNRGRRRSPPPPPSPGRTGPSRNLRLPSETSSNSGSDSRRYTVRRPPPPPPQSPRQSRVPRSQVNTSFRSSVASPLDPAVMSALSKLTQHIGTIASSAVTEGLSGQAHGRHRSMYGGYVSKTNCVDITGSNVDGLTFNSGGSNNSGAVIHKTKTTPQVVRSPRHVPPF